MNVLFVNGLFEHILCLRTLSCVKNAVPLMMFCWFLSSDVAAKGQERSSYDVSPCWRHGCDSRTWILDDFHPANAALS